jgi:hypothetical protein
VNIDRGNRSLSWTHDGVLLPAEDSAPKLYERMFVQGDPESVARQLQKIESRGSILDTLLDETKRFSRNLASEDKARLARISHRLIPGFESRRFLGRVELTAGSPVDTTEPIAPAAVIAARSGIHKTPTQRATSAGGMPEHH